MLDQHEAVGVERQFARLAAVGDVDAMALLGAARAPPDVVRPEGLVDQLLAAVARIGDFGLHDGILEWPKPQGGLGCATAASFCAWPRSARCGRRRSPGARRSPKASRSTICTGSSAPPGSTASCSPTRST